MDEKLNFCHLLSKENAKANKDICFVKKFHNVLSRKVLLTIPSYYLSCLCLTIFLEREFFISSKNVMSFRNYI